jgi:hypothetical protein
MPELLSLLRNFDTSKIKLDENNLSIAMTSNAEERYVSPLRQRSSNGHANQAFSMSSELTDTNTIM